MTHTIPAKNWTIALADSINKSQPGDIIIVTTESQKQMGEKAKQRTCPNKPLSFEVKVLQRRLKPCFRAFLLLLIPGIITTEDKSVW